MSMARGPVKPFVLHAPLLQGRLATAVTDGPLLLLVLKVRPRLTAAHTAFSGWDTRPHPPTHLQLSACILHACPLPPHEHPCPLGFEPAFCCRALHRKDSLALRQ